MRTHLVLESQQREEGHALDIRDDVVMVVMGGEVGVLHVIQPSIDDGLRLHIAVVAVEGVQGGSDAGDGEGSLLLMGQGAVPEQGGVVAGEDQVVLAPAGEQTVAPAAVLLALSADGALSPEALEVYLVGLEQHSQDARLDTA